MQKVEKKKRIQKKLKNSKNSKNSKKFIKYKMEPQRYFDPSYNSSKSHMFPLSDLIDIDPNPRITEVCD